MKTFEEFITEKNFVTKHYRSPEMMATIKKNNLVKKGHTILKHETNDAGEHIIHHMSPKKKVRITTVGTKNPGRNKTGLMDRPAPKDIRTSYGQKH